MEAKLMGNLGDRGLLTIKELDKLTLFERNLLERASRRCSMGKGIFGVTFDFTTRTHSLFFIKALTIKKYDTIFYPEKGGIMQIVYEAKGIGTITNTEVNFCEEGRKFKISEIGRTEYSSSVHIWDVIIWLCALICAQGYALNPNLSTGQYVCVMCVVCVLAVIASRIAKFSSCAQIKLYSKSGGEIALISVKSDDADKGREFVMQLSRLLG